MKIIAYIFFSIVSVFTCSVSAFCADTLQLATKENKSVEPIGFNAETYEQFKQDKNYDYYHVKPEQQPLYDRILEAISKWLDRNIHSGITPRQVGWTVTIIVILIILSILYAYKPSLFYIDRNKKTDFRVEDEDIHALDFDKLIKESLASGRYSDAVRWTYLSTLKALHGKDLISWDPRKTTNEYVQEMNRTDLKPVFKELSKQFLYYRYGNFEVLQTTFEKFSLLSNEISKRL